MKIGIDARMLGPQCGGLGRYIEQLVKQLEKIDQTNQYVLFMRKDNWDRFEPVGSNFTKVLADIHWYSLGEQIKFSAIIKKEKVNLMHFPHWNVPIIYQGSFVVTIHDLIMYHFPRSEATLLNPLLYWLKDKIHRLVVRRSAHRAEKIIVTSDFTSHDVQQTLELSPEKMLVTYQAPFHYEWVGNIKKHKQEILDKYRINKPYILYVGVAFPHKNLLGLLEAWKIFQAKNGGNYQLVLVGRHNRFYEQVLIKIKTENISGVIFTDFVEDDELAILYENSYLYIFPSLYEGFGLPPLEAMTYGVPVVSSSRSSLPEVLGEAAIYFDPENYQQMADVMESALLDKDMQMQLQENARENLKRFSWERLAKQTLAIYRGVDEKRRKN